MRRRYWQLGFLSLLGINGIVKVIQGDLLTSVWLLWFVWVVWFLPVKESGK
ncbi:hypothetical protein QA601_14555 [Chitinispirillales bacterium ANBcel5]|uniref:hypothetical protein n=1 Tax=Cellulosispirillum alkaliphilum TaxID=3039283 RepID=UPI002A581F05|nr:hypothetical protein [Chitinispirillales bacterium ANBcel5]